MLISSKPIKECETFNQCHAARLSNEAFYYENKDDYMKIYKGKFILISDRKLVKVVDTIFDITIAYDTQKDGPAYYTWVGREKDLEKEKERLAELILSFEFPEEQNLLLFAIVQNSTHMFWKHNVKELEMTNTKDFKPHYGITSLNPNGIQRIFCSVLVKASKKDDYGIPITFLLDTGSPYTFIHKKKALKLFENIEHKSPHFFFY